MSTAGVFVELDSSLIARLDQLAMDEERNRSSLISDALTQFLNVREYHLACVQEGIRQADAGMLTPMDDALEQVRKRIAQR
ncbi:CopG family ribbon-helix-helix protein [Terriglobus sp. RCC_193]|uniref:CopG family ribbon-helix-helix protein n=1 Tax=Terriglobus sp. RCC_193 TaxID=3239218 RepID=UPI0035237C00